MPKEQVSKESIRTTEAFERVGVLHKIRGYETIHNLAANPIQYLDQTTVTTDLDFAPDDGEMLPIEFKGFVGHEMVGHRMTYRQTTKKVDGELDSRRSTEDTVIQELIPEDDNLPKYKAVDAKFVR